jgi:hypothetical protein
MTTEERHELEARYLAELRDRVAWQAEAADRARRGLPPPSRRWPLRVVPDPEPSPKANGELR